MPKIKLTIEYLGTDFCGWQSQKNGVSVQDTVEKALGKYFDVPFVRVTAAGRTDVGVHARGQTAHFVVEKPVNLYKLCLGVNVNLPRSVAITAAEFADDPFDARFSAISKTYCYRIYISSVRKPLLDETHLQIFKPLNVDAMRAAARLLVGEHDFAAFQKNGSNLKGTVRKINVFEIVEKRDMLSINRDEGPLQGEETLANCAPQPTVIEFWVNGNAFLYNQVRIMCGLLVEVGKGKFDTDDVSHMLNGEKLSFKTLSAKGLTLEKVYY